MTTRDGATATMSLTIFLVVSSMALLGSALAESSSSSSPFRIIIDGGSTGSRLHVFEFVSQASDDDSEHDVPPATDCVRRGSSRANIPLSAFGRLSAERHTPLNATEVAEHMLPLFEYASTVIPAEFHSTTGVKYQATAGMRLLEPSEQDAVYDALYTGLMGSDQFAFRGMQRSDIATLSGELEGFYGAVAANYLTDLVDTNMRMLPSAQDDSMNDSPPGTVEGPIGALDMGGSSTQIVFLTGEADPSQSCVNGQMNSQPEADNDEQTCENVDMGVPSHLKGDDFFSTSYLSYGVDQFRERLWSTWVRQRIIEEEQSPDSCLNKSIPNPCSNIGYEQEWQGFTLVGTGDTDECIRLVQKLIPHPEEEVEMEGDQGRRVGGVEHPPVRGKFFAMSLYFFTLDSLRELSHPKEDAHEALNLSWPNPSIEELHDALEGLCSRSWQGDLEEIQDNAHKFTRREVLPHRCLESVYMVTLLRDGFGFHPSSRDITFTFLVDGSEVEWTLGMAIVLNADQDAERDAPEEPQTTSESCSIENYTNYNDHAAEDKVRHVMSGDAPFHSLHLMES